MDADSGQGGATSSTLRRAGPPGAAAARATQAVTPRAVLLGALFAVISAATGPYLSFRMGVWLPGSDSLMTAPLLVLVGLVAMNAAVLRCRPRWALARGELLVVYVMLIVSLGWMTKGGLPFLVGLLTYPFYRATPANNWHSLVWPYLPPWLRVDDPNAVVWLWESRPEHAAVPWAAWWDPGLAWSAFIFALMVAMLCAAVLLRRDWIERQRLAFPLAEIPLAITGPAAHPGLGDPHLRNRLFLIGFGFPTALGLAQWLHRFFPAVPALDLYMIPVGRNFSGMGLPWNVLSDATLTISWATIGVMCLIPSDVALGLGLFYLLNKAQLVGWSAAGLGRGPSTSGIDPGSFTSFEQAGGLVVLAGLVIYESRHSFRSAWRGLWRREQEADPTAPFPGRAAVLGLLVSSAAMLWFGLHLGASWWSFAVLMGLYFMAALVGSKLVAAGGVLSYHTGLYQFERQTMTGLLGTRIIGPQSLVVTTYLSQVFMEDPANIPMLQMVNALKLGHVERLRGRALTWAMLLAIALVLVVGLPAMLDMVYRYGAGALDRWPFTLAGDGALGDIDAALRDPTPAMAWKGLAMGVGGAAMLVMSWMQLRFLWWPVSPLGFVIASGWATENELWCCALIGWVVTSLIKRYGGLRLYRTLRPAFLGLVLGDVLTGSLTGMLSAVVDWKRLVGQ
jgi:hypothetical protein